MARREIKLTSLGSGVDLGLMADTTIFAPWSSQTAVLCMRLIAAAAAWVLSRDNAVKLFSFLVSPHNYFDGEAGLCARLAQSYGSQVRHSRRSSVGNSMKRLAHHIDEIPGGQDIVVLHLGEADFLRQAPVLTFRRHTRLVLQEIARKNPGATLIVHGLYDLVAMTVGFHNNRPSLPLPGAPSVATLQKLQGYQGKLGLNPNSAPEDMAAARSLLKTYNSILRTELDLLMTSSGLAAARFIDPSEKPIYGDNQRGKIFAMDGIHLSAQGCQELLKEDWQVIRTALIEAALQASNTRQPLASRSMRKVQ